MSSLLLTPDDELEGFRRACLGAESQVAARHLVLARQLLKEIGRALAENDAELWKRLTAAHDLVTGETSAAPPKRPSEPEPRVAVGLPRTPPGVAPAPPELLAAMPPAEGPSQQVVPTAPRAPRAQAPAPLPPAVLRWAAVLGPPAEPGPEGPRPAAATVNIEDGARPAGAGTALPDGALPFAKGARPAPPPLALAQARREALALPGSSEETLPATSLSAKDRAKLDALPFHKDAAEPPETGPAQRAAPRRPPPIETLDAEECTLAQAPAARHLARLDAPDETDTTKVELPLAPLPPRLEAMPLEQFAAMCAECSYFPDYVQQIQLRYGVASPLERRAVDELWRQRMAVDPSLHARWLELCGRLTRMLRSNPPR